MKKIKTKDYDLRAALVRRLLDKGWPRRDIRHEITLDTSSSGGRVDIMLIEDARLTAIEIKSGSDNLDLLRDQIAAYKQAFDRLLVIADTRHLEGLAAMGMDWRTTFYCGEKGFVHCNIYTFDSGGLRSKEVRMTPACPVAGISEYRGAIKSGRTSPAAMARLLWRDEALHLGAQGKRLTRQYCLKYAQEHMPLSAVRRTVVQQLRERVLNKWEEAFWQKFEAEAVPA